MYLLHLVTDTKKFIRRLKILDYIIIIALLLFGIIIYKFLNPEEKWIDLVILDTNVPIYQLAALHKGDIEKGPTGEKMAEITDLEIYDTPNTPISNKDIFISLKILAKINPRSREYEYKNKIIKIGSPSEFKFNSGLANGVIVDMEGAKPRIAETKVLTLILYGQWIWFADSIKVGSGEIDEKGKKIVEVISKEVKPAEITVDTSTGEKLLKTDPQKVDITLKVNIQAQKINNEFIFRKNKKLLVGEQFSFNASDTTVKDALIEDIQ